MKYYPSRWSWERKTPKELSLDTNEIEKAVLSAGGDITARRYEGLNHLFQPAETGLITEYATIEITFDEAVLRDIVAWILENAGR